MDCSWHELPGARDHLPGEKRSHSSYIPQENDDLSRQARVKGKKNSDKFHTTQTRNVGRLTADLTVRVLSFGASTADGSASQKKREELLSVLWSMIYWQAATQALSFAGGALNRIVARRIRRGLQLALYSELLRKDIR